MLIFDGKNNVLPTCCALAAGDIRVQKPPMIAEQLSAQAGQHAHGGGMFIGYHGASGELPS